MGAGHHHHGPSGHAHDDPARRAAGTRALTWSLVFNGAFLLVEAAVGFATDSLALLSDATHMVSDVAALALALAAARLAQQPATGHRTYGLVRAEVLGAFVNAVAMLAVVIFIFKEAIERLAAGPPAIPRMPVLIVGSLGLAINLGSAWFLWRSDRENINIRGALVHMLADALGSVGAMIAAVLTLTLGLNAADAVASMAIGLLVLYGTWGILRDSTRVLLELAPVHLSRPVVDAVLRRLEGVDDVHDLHVWSLGHGNAIITAHLVVAEGADGARVLHRAQHALEDLGVHHSTLQLESHAVASDPHHDHHACA